MKNEKTIVDELENKPKQQKIKKTIEISPEAKEERRLLAAFLLDKKEELIIERNKRKELLEREPIRLQNGKTISRLEIRLLVTSLEQNYDSVFPNDNPFFKNMFRLHPKLMKHDYSNYRKPRLAGKLLKRLTYDRFKIEVLPSLIVFAMIDGFWITKCYKHLTQQGVELLIKYRDQANKMMDKYNDGEWYNFYAEFCEKHKGQKRLF